MDSSDPEVRFADREESLEATWARAGIEESRAEALFLSGEPGSAAHYRAAQRALVPQGAVFTSIEENDRRMQAYRRITDRLYAIGPDGRPRPGHGPQPPTPPEPAPAPPPAPARRSHIDQLHRDSDHWHYYRLAALWFDAARTLAAEHPREAESACQWSLCYFERYNRAWNAHLPASRWDSDGGAEMMEVQQFAGGLGAALAESSLAEWARRLVEGDWVGALDSYSPGLPAPELKPLTLLLADACVCAGQPEVAQRLLATLT